MSDSLSDAPAVARQRVRRALRKARQQAELTQRDVARQLGWSLSKVQRIEGADVAVSETDLKALLSLFDVTAPAVVDPLLKQARLSRRERWLTPAEHREHLSSPYRQLLQFEAVATEIRCYQPFLIPGPLQTAAMAEFIIDQWGQGTSAEVRKVKFDARMSRRKLLNERSEPPTYHLILDESVLERKTGGARIMAEQLESLGDATERPNIFVRVVPFQRGGVIGALGSFVLAAVGDDDDDYVLYRERFRQDEMDYDPETIRPYREAFEDVWKQSLQEDATRRLIRAKALTLRAELDRL